MITRKKNFAKNTNIKLSELSENVSKFISNTQSNEALVEVVISEFTEKEIETLDDIDLEEEYTECDCSKCEDKYECEDSTMKELFKFSSKELLEELYLNRKEIISQCSTSPDGALDVFTFVIKKEGYIN